MKLLTDVVNKVMDVIKGMDIIPVDVVHEYRGMLANVPIHSPTITVGVRDLTMEMDKMRAYGGTAYGYPEYSIPTDIELCANIYIPRHGSGIIQYSVLSYMADALFYSDELDVYKIKSGPVSYDGNFLCSVLSVSIFLHARLCGNSGA